MHGCNRAIRGSDAAYSQCCGEPPPARTPLGASANVACAIIGGALHACSFRSISVFAGNTPPPPSPRSEYGVSCVTYLRPVAGCCFSFLRGRPRATKPQGSHSYAHRWRWLLANCGVYSIFESSLFPSGSDAILRIIASFWLEALSPTLLSSSDLSPLRLSFVPYTSFCFVRTGDVAFAMFSARAELHYTAL